MVPFVTLSDLNLDFKVRCNI